MTTEHLVLLGSPVDDRLGVHGPGEHVLASVSGGLVALGLIATATHVGSAFYAFSLVVLPRLVFVGLVTFDRVLQSGIEDVGYARRIAWLRSYYFDQAPELTPYLLSVAPVDRLTVLGVRGGRWQGFLTVAGMVGVITAVLAGSTAGLVAVAAFDHPLVVALAAGAVVAVGVLLTLMRYQHAAWLRAASAPLIANDEDLHQPAANASHLRED